jgi:DNA-directed RNA polymerase specialized sigma24 family protein
MQTHLTSSKRPSDLADGVLVQQAHLDDHSAFEMLVDQYSILLLRLISRLLRDEHLAHDVLQYVFLQLYRSPSALRKEGTLKGWLCLVARHRCSQDE